MASQSPIVHQPEVVKRLRGARGSGQVEIDRAGVEVWVSDKSPAICFAIRGHTVSHLHPLLDFIFRLALSADHLWLGLLTACGSPGPTCDIAGMYLAKEFVVGACQNCV